MQPRDLQQLRERGIDPVEAQRQLRFLRRPPPARGPEAPCTPGDGVRRIEPADEPRLLERWERAAATGRLTKFVPASGAATRMFRALRAYVTAEPPPAASELARRAAEGDAAARDLVRFFESLDALALRRPLAASLAAAGRDLDRLLAAGAWLEIARHALGADGLALDEAPKALVPFHDYPEEPRTAFIEHFVEAAGYLAPAGGTARLHFTVPAGSEPEFTAIFRERRAWLERKTGVRFELGLSFQDPATDTLAVDPDGEPFRLEDGSLLLRPSGHGALIGNLDRLGADLVLIKNIDNVPPERLQPVTVRWKRLLIGLAAELSERLAELARRLGEGKAATDEAYELLTTHVAARPAPEAAGGESAARRAWVAERLARPLRVCGVVENAGEPGGGPFWVAGPDGGIYGQIVEAAQVDRNDPAQLAAWEGATHFNPVDLVCALRRPDGEPHALERFVDVDAAFVSRKSHDGQPLVALERPGLWNDAMAGWNTAFIEVPAETFQPVKTVLDLLRPGHRV